jgi:hypothetical protein
MGDWRRLIWNLLLLPEGDDVSAREVRELLHDTRQIARAFSTALFFDAPNIQTALGLPENWRKEFRAVYLPIIARGAAHNLGSTERERARELHKALGIYRASASFRADRDGVTRPKGDRSLLCLLLRLNRDRVPSEGAIRTWIRN